MKFLLDQGIPRSAAGALASVGHDAVHVGEVGLGSASDERIVLRATEDARIIITLDADFHSILAARQFTAPSTIRIACTGITSS